MRRVFALLCALLMLVWAGAATADDMTLLGVSQAGGVVSTYAGPGDQTTFTAWYSCARGYNGAYATGSNKACNLRRASDSTTQDINILPSGNFDVASANTFAGTDATCTGTIVSTTLTCASASSTPHAGSTLTGTGITQPSYIISCGTFTAGAGTCTLNAAQTVSVGETITMQYGLLVTKAYDQTVGNACTAASCDQAQATTANQPQWLPNCGNSLPCTITTTSTMAIQSANNFAPSTGVVSFQLVTNRAAGTGQGVLLGENSSSGTTGNRIVQGTSSNQLLQVGGSANTITATSSDASFHADVGVMNGASSVLAVDGTETTGSGTGSTTAAPIFVRGAGSTTLEETEWGFTDNVAYSGTVRTNLCHNMRLYYGTSGSC